MPGKRDRVSLDELRQRAIGSRGLVCPNCDGPQFAEEGGKSLFPVSATRLSEGGITRYRTCVHCGHRFSTTER
jgi:hypothetical protein